MNASDGQNPIQSPCRPAGAIPTPLHVPEVGPGEALLRLCGWLVEEGEYVAAGDDVAELLIHGVTFNVAATVSGVLRQICVFPAQRVQTGEILGWIEPHPPAGNSAELSGSDHKEADEEKTTGNGVSVGHFLSSALFSSDEAIRPAGINRRSREEES